MVLTNEPTVLDNPPWPVMGIALLYCTLTPWEPHHLHILCVLLFAVRNRTSAGGIKLLHVRVNVGYRVTRCA
jgi:hypothetical protein